MFRQELSPAFRSGTAPLRDHAGIVNAVASWCEALHGRVSIADALSQLVVGLGAEAGMLVRTPYPGAQPSKVAHYDRLRGLVAHPLRLSFAGDQFGPSLDHARAGSVWIASSQADEGMRGVFPVLSEWQAARGMKDFAALVLSTGAAGRDHLELRFRVALTADDERTLNEMMPSITRTWASRQMGIVTRTLAVSRGAENAGHYSTQASILGLSNPARLSRAEYRVCLLLSRGFSASGVAAELSLTEATIRSHLRSIYAKTDTHSLAELVFRLLGSRAEDQPDLRRQA
jgi:DNA-binding CsgD family transcriptional regulator